MRISLTGVPGVGKTSVSKLVAARLGLRVIDLNIFARSNGLIEEYDPVSDSEIVNTEKAAEMLAEEDNVIFEGHWSNEIPADILIVLRLDPEKIVERLLKRGYKEKKAYANAMAEALDTYSKSLHRVRLDINTTGLTHEQVVEKIVNVIRTHAGDQVDWAEWLDKNVEKLEKLGL